jgi:hypothetical protein
MIENLKFDETISSNRTEALFIALTLLFLSLTAWRVSTARFDLVAAIFFLLLCLFFFYSFNYRKLNIQITDPSLVLKFGVFTWIVPVDEIAECRLDDDIPTLKKYGGAGIHFMNVNERYRASFNFLEYPRVVIKLKVQRGRVKDISFSTRHPDEVVRLLAGAISGHE